MPLENRNIEIGSVHKVYRDGVITDGVLKSADELSIAVDDRGIIRALAEFTSV